VASPNAISATSDAIVRLLNDAWTVEGRAGIVSKVFASEDFETSPSGHGVGLFLYRVVVNGPQRNRAARVIANGTRMRPSLPVDLYYILTPWGTSVVTQHEILGWAMRILEDSAILPAGLLNSIYERAFMPSETVEIVTDPISLQDQTGLWQSLRTSWRLSVGYVARMVALDSTKAFPNGPLVRVRELDYRGPENS
jgi:hypothetical protein